MKWSIAIGLLVGCALPVFRLTAAEANTNALSGFQLKPGFQLQLVAAEPLIFDPVALAFDGNGRLFVAEARNYPGLDDGPTHAGRVKLLEDGDGDGRYDTSQDFAEDLRSPSALICWDRGVIVAAGAEIIHCKDTNNDGRADVRTVLFTASARTPETPLALRSFVWGLDCRVHVAAGGLSGGGVVAEDLPGHDFAFHPRASSLDMESSYGSTGVSFDSRGRKFVCDAMHPLRQVMWEGESVALNPTWVLSPPLQNLTGTAAQTPIFPLREVGPPPGSAARKQVQPIADHFSAASSLLVNRGNAFPAAYSEDVFVADARANLVRRFKLRDLGVELEAGRPAEDRNAEFLATTNTWFRPMQLASGPDGALYVVDLHREILDPPSDRPAGGDGTGEELRGNDRGRIYRIVPDKFKRPPAPRLESATTHDLLMNLAHLNGWHRDTAARLLCERQEATAVPLLSNMVVVAKSPLARLHALAVLSGLGGLQEAHVTRGLGDTDERVRQFAVRLAAEVGGVDGRVSAGLASALRPLSGDATPAVRYELALVLSRISHPRRQLMLLEILQRNPENPWVRAAVLNGLAAGAGDSFVRLLDDARFRGTPAGGVFLRDLALLVGTRNDRDEVAGAISALNRLENVELALTLLCHLNDGLSRAGSRLTAHDPELRLSPAYQRALLVAADSPVEAPVRDVAIRLLTSMQFGEIGEVLLALVGPTEHERAQLAALQALSRYNEARVGVSLAQRWRGLSDAVRPAALEVLLAWPVNAAALLDGIQSGRIGRQALSPAQLTFLRSHPDAGISRRAVAILGARSTGDRREAVKSLLPTLKLKGNPTHGRQVYADRCAGCHRFRNEGYELGPDLESAASRGREWVLDRFVNPNRVKSPRASLWAVGTRDAGDRLGLIEEETPAGLVLCSPEGVRTAIPRAAILSALDLEVSVMPEGLETGLAPQDVADLLEYLDRK